MKKLIEYFKKLFHKHSFDIKDVCNLDIDPKCTCGKTLSEAAVEKGIKF